MSATSWLHEVLLGNWRNKGVALFFAVLIWYVAFRSEKKEYVPLVAVDIVSQDKDFIVKQVTVDTEQSASGPAFDGNVLVSFSGPRKGIDKLRDTPFPRVRISVPPERASHTFRQEDFGFPREGVEIIQFEPTSVLVSQEEKATITIPNLSEQIRVTNYPEGYEVTQRDVVPPTQEVRITGPKSVVSGMGVTLQVTMGFLRDRYDGPAEVTPTFKADVPEAVRQTVQIEPREVRVLVAIRAGMEVWPVDSIRISFRIPPVRIPVRIVLDDVVGDTIPVEFHGRKDDMARLKDTLRQQPGFSLGVAVPMFDREVGGQFTFTEDSLELYGFPGIQIRQHESRRKDKKTAWSYKIVPVPEETK